MNARTLSRREFVAESVLRQPHWDTSQVTIERSHPHRVLMIQSKKRRQWSANEKMRIVLASMEPGVETSELCRQEGINPTQRYS